MLPAQVVQFGYICELAHGAVGLGGVEDQVSGKAHHFPARFASDAFRAI